MFLLVFFANIQAKAFDIDVLDVPNKPGKCQILVQDGKKTIEWVGDCTNLEDEGLQHISQQIQPRQHHGSFNEKSSSN